jgi:hypothetical protein
MFVTAEPSAHARFRRALERRALWMAEDAARELPGLPLQDALQLVHLYGERGSAKYEKAALRWLERYLAEGEPTLERVAEMAIALSRRAPLD